MALEDLDNLSDLVKRVAEEARSGSIPVAWSQNGALEGQEYRFIHGLMLEYSRVVKDWMKKGLAVPDPQAALAALLEDGRDIPCQDSTDSKLAQELNRKLLSLQHKMFSQSGTRDLVAAFMDFGESEKRFSNAQAKMVLGSAGFAPSTKWEKEALKTWANEQVTLVKNLSDQYVKKITQYVSNAAISGTTSKEIAAKLLSMDHTMTVSRAKLIARDQVGKLNGTMMRARFEASGLSLYVWRTAADERVRGNPGGLYPDAVPSHWIMEGKICRWDDSTLYLDDTGQWVRRTNDMPLVHPGMAIQCRCTAAPVDDELFGGMAPALPYLEEATLEGPLDQEAAQIQAAAAAAYRRVDPGLKEQLAPSKERVWGGADFVGQYSIYDAVDWQNAPHGVEKMLENYAKRSLRRVAGKKGEAYYDRTTDVISLYPEVSKSTRVHEMGHAVFAAQVKKYGEALKDDINKAFYKDIKAAWSKSFAEGFARPASTLLDIDDAWEVLDTLGIHRGSGSRLSQALAASSDVVVRTLATALWDGNPWGVLYVFRNTQALRFCDIYDAWEMMLGHVRYGSEEKWPSGLGLHKPKYSVAKAMRNEQWIEAPAEIAELLFAGDSGLDIDSYRMFHYLFPNTAAEIADAMDLDDAAIGVTRHLTAETLQYIVKAKLSAKGKEVTVTYERNTKKTHKPKLSGWLAEVQKGKITSGKTAWRTQGDQSWTELWEATRAEREGKVKEWEKVAFTKIQAKPTATTATPEALPTPKLQVVPAAPPIKAGPVTVPSVAAANLKGRAAEVYATITSLAEPMTVTGLAKQMNLTPQQVSAVTQRLIKAGILKQNEKRQLVLVTQVTPSSPVPKVPASPVPPSRPTPPVQLKGRAEQVYNLIASGVPMTVSELARQLGLRPQQVSPITLKLQSMGVIHHNEHRQFLVGKGTV